MAPISTDLRTCCRGKRNRFADLRAWTTWSRTGCSSPKLGKLLPSLGSSGEKVILMLTSESEMPQRHSLATLKDGGPFVSKSGRRLPEDSVERGQGPPPADWMLPMSRPCQGTDTHVGRVATTVSLGQASNTGYRGHYHVGRERACVARRVLNRNVTEMPWEGMFRETETPGRAQLCCAKSSTCTSLSQAWRSWAVPTWNVRCLPSKRLAQWSWHSSQGETQLPRVHTASLERSVARLRSR